MDTAAASHATARMSADAVDRYPAEPGDGSAFELLQSLVREVPGLISDRIELFSLEVGRAGSALAKILALTVAAAILGVTAWLALWAGVVMLLVSLDWHWTIAVGVVILVNLGAAGWAVLQMRRLARLVALPATRRHLTLSASARAVAARSVPVSSAADEAANSASAHEDAHAHAVR